MSRCRILAVLAFLLLLPISAGSAGIPEVTRAGDEDEEPLREVLRATAEAVRSIGQEAAGLRVPDFRTFSLRLDDEEHTRALLAVGDALAKLGDRESADEAWQDAIDSAGRVDGPEDRAGLLLQVAESQARAGVKADALDTARQAYRAARQIKAELPSELPIPDGDAAEKKAVVMGRTAAAQGLAGDANAARATFEQAAKAAGAIKDSTSRAAALARIARARAESGDKAGAGPIWDEASRQALAESDTLGRAKAIEAILRERVASGELEEATATVEGMGPSDLRAYGTWAVADAITDRKEPAPAALLGRLRAVADLALFDRFSGRIRTYTEIARAQVRAGDDEGAFQTVDILDDPNLFRYHHERAKVEVLRELAEARLKAGDRESARKLLTQAAELGASFRDEDGLSGLPWDVLAIQEARAGDLGGATTITEALSSAVDRVDAFAGIAVAQAEAGDKEGARQSTMRAVDAMHGIVAQMLWSGADMPSLPGLRSDMRPRALRVIAITQVKTGDIDGAKKTIEQLVGRKEMLDRFELLEAISTASGLLAEAGDLASAKGLLSSLGDDDPFMVMKRSEIVARLATAQAEAGDAKGALEWAKTLGTPKEKGLAMTGLAQGIARWKDKKESANRPSSDGGPKPEGSQPAPGR